MFRHKVKSAAAENPAGTREEADKRKEEAKPEKPAEGRPPLVKEEAAKDASPGALRELLEKNLKWSQIIYEQNRKINRRMFWYAFTGWLRLLVILAPIILAIIFLPPIVKDLWAQYGQLLGAMPGKSPATTAPPLNPSSLEQLFKLLPIDTAQQQQLKEILK